MSSSLNSVLETAGPQAFHLERLWWLILLVCAGVFVVVMAFLAGALLRRRTAEEDAHSHVPARHALRVIASGAGITAVILFGFLVASILADRRLYAIERPDALLLTITGHQWWWDVRYEDAQPAKIVTTANEIHIPVGRPVRLQLRANDVIHSFWAPSLAGKTDLIPGRENNLWLQADKPGVYQGQCAEFCGHQHAKMRFLVIAQPPAEFESWIAQQRASAAEPASDAARRGREVFLSATCVMCHNISGTIAGSRAGPDLTHFASRRTLAAGALPNTRENLAAWLSDPQAIKPGTRMPAGGFDPKDRDALVAYLESLR